MKKKVFLQPKLKKKRNIKNERNYKWMSIHSFIMSKWEFFCPMQSQGKLFPESDLTSLQSGLHVPKNEAITSHLDAPTPKNYYLHEERKI